MRVVHAGKFDHDNTFLYFLMFCTSHVLAETGLLFLRCSVLGLGMLCLYGERVLPYGAQPLPFREHLLPYGAHPLPYREHRLPYREHLLPYREHILLYREHILPYREHLLLYREHSITY